MSRLAWISVGATIALGACAYPDFVFNGSSGAGAHGGSATSTVSTGGSGPSCKPTHPGGGSCEYLPGKECGCSAQKKCSVVDPTTGASACLTAGTTPDNSACTSTADCLSGSWCEQSTSVCEPICAGACGGGGTCVHALQGTTGTATIPGLDVCTVSCDLLSGSPCGSGATCVVTTANDTECVVSGMVDQNMNCAHPADCLPGLLCIYDSLAQISVCAPWCTSIGDPCPNPQRQPDLRPPEPPRHARRPGLRLLRQLAS